MTFIKSAVATAAVLGLSAVAAPQKGNSVGSGGSVAASPSVTTRQIVLSHPSGTATVEYRSDVATKRRQVGSVAPGGRVSTLRCLWTVDLLVDRTAVLASNAIASRSFTLADVARGYQIGWCRPGSSINERANAVPPTQIDKHMANAIAADRPVLIADLERLHAQRNGV